MYKLLLIGLGGGFGTILRYLVAGWSQKFSDSSFPLGTLVVNVSGCFAVGFLGMLFTGPSLIREEYRIAILVGILGGYTTFSTFGLETLKLASAGQMWFAMLNVLLSNGVGLLAAWLGHRIAIAWYGV